MYQPITHKVNMVLMAVGHRTSVNYHYLWLRPIELEGQSRLTCVGQIKWQSLSICVDNLLPQGTWSILVPAGRDCPVHGWLHRADIYIANDVVLEKRIAKMSGIKKKTFSKLTTVVLCIFGNYSTSVMLCWRIFNILRLVVDLRDQYLFIYLSIYLSYGI